MSEETEAKLKPKRRKKRTSGWVRGPIEVRAGGKRYYGYDFAYTACGLMVTLHDRKVLIPVTKPIEIFQAPQMPGGMPAPRTVPYDPQLPHNAEGNLSLDELERLQQRQRQEREREVAYKREQRNMEFDEAANGSGLPPFTPTLVTNG